MGETKEIVVRLEPALHAELVTRAKADDRSMAATVRYALRLYLSRPRSSHLAPVASWTPAPSATGANPPPAVTPHHPDAGPPPRWPDHDDPASTLRYPDVEVSTDHGKTWTPFDLAVRAPLRSTCADNRCHDDSHGNLYRAVGSDADPANPVLHPALTDGEYRDLLRRSSEWHRTNGGRRGQ
jgi:hypothetical protein